MRNIQKQTSDHRFLFPLALVSFFIAPYLVNFLHIPHSFTYPNAWMLGLLFFALGAYFIGTRIQDDSYLLKLSDQKTRFFVLGILFLLLCLLFTHYGLPLQFGFVSATVTVILIHYLLTPHFTIRHSFLLIILSLSLIFASFIVMGGIPLIDRDLRTTAVLSPIREVALPLFLLGATSLSIKARNIRFSKAKHAIPLVLFLVGFTVFLSNGKRTDAATMLITCLIYFLRTYSYKVVTPAIALASGIRISVAYLQPSILGLFRQNFNFQLLRHIMSYVQHPLSGETHGAITFGINQQFLGPRLLYGGEQNWTLTSTWLGPGYLDFGLPGVLMTMVGIAAVMQFFLSKVNVYKENDKFEVVYVVTLALMLSLFEDGLDLFGVIFLFAMFYATLSEKGANYTLSKVEKAAKKSKSIVKAKKKTVLIGLISVGLLMIAWSFEAEFQSYSTVAETSMKKGTNVITTVLTRRYYQIEVFGGEWAAGRLRGELNITRLGITAQHFEIDYLFWFAKRDIVDVGWFRPEEAGNYTITIFLERVPHSSQETIMKLKESPFSAFMPNYAMLGSGAALVIAPLALSLFVRKVNEFVEF